MHHSDWTLPSDGTQDRQTDGMIAAGRHRNDPLPVKRSKKLGVLGVRTLKFKRLLDPGIADIGDAGQGVWLNCSGRVDASHDTRLIADRRRAMAGGAPI